MEVVTREVITREIITMEVMATTVARMAVVTVEEVATAVVTMEGVKMETVTMETEMGTAMGGTMEMENNGNGAMARNLGATTAKGIFARKTEEMGVTDKME